MTRFSVELQQVIEQSLGMLSNGLQATVSLSEPHLWVKSSGSSTNTQQSDKWIALSGSALELAATAVVKELDAQPGERWGLCLPEQHISGISVRLRCALAEGELVLFQNPWNASAAFAWLVDQKINHISLVPTQLHDWVMAGLRCPTALRSVLVGGSFLADSLHERAIDLGWPLLVSYGMTETAAMIARRQKGLGFQTLPHADWAIHPVSGQLGFRTKALMTGYWQEQSDQQQSWFLAKCDQDGFWWSEDLAEPLGNGFNVVGRKGRDFVKIKGIGVNLAKVNEQWQQFSESSGETLLVARKNLRSGAELILIGRHATDQALMNLVEQWNQTNPTHLNIVECVDMLIPRSAIGKPLWGKIEELLRTLNC